MKKYKPCLVLLFFVLCMWFNFVPSALAGFKRGSANNARLDSGKIILERGFSSDGYIPKREVQKMNYPFASPANVYKHGKKIGTAKKSMRNGDIFIYDKSGKKVGYYRKKYR